MHGLALIYVIRDLPHIKSFKVVQESLKRTRVQLVVSDAYDSSLTAIIVDGIRRRLGRSVDVEVEFLDDIPRERSGKFRYVVSRVADGAATLANADDDRAQIGDRGR